MVPQGLLQPFQPGAGAMGAIARAVEGQIQIRQMNVFNGHALALALGHKGPS
jgi:hypothetical protein